MYVYYALMAAAAIYGAYATSQAGKSMPSNPSLVKPDYNPLNEWSSFTDYQNETRSKALAEYYGGEAQNNKIKDGFASEFWNRGEVANAYGGHTQVPPVTRRWENTFTGTKPMEQYKAAQGGVLDNSQAQFSDDLAKYYAARGIEDTGQVADANTQLLSTYDQRRKDINARSQDIYTMTLGNLFGEVSDAGAQAGQLVSNVGMAAQKDNQQRQNSYANAMQRWQYEQGKPSTLGTVASLLPYLGMMYGQGGGTGYTPVPTGAQTTTPNYNLNGVGGLFANTTW